MRTKVRSIGSTTVGKRIEKPRQVDALELTRDDDRREAGIVDRRVALLDRGPIEDGDGVLQAARWSGERRVGRVDRRPEAQFGEAAWVRTRLHQVGQPLVAQALHLAGRERRSREDLDEQGHSRLETMGRHSERQREAVPPGFGRQLGPQSLRRLDELDRGVTLGPLGEGVGGQDGNAPPGRGLVGGPALENQADRNERTAGQVGRHELGPVGEGAPLEVREVVGPRPARRRTDVEDGEIDRHVEVTTSARRSRRRGCRA